MNITGFKCIDESGAELDCDTFGHNAAVNCPACRYPLLMTAVRNKIGSSKSRATTCPGCQRLFYLKVFEPDTKIIIYEKR